MVYSKLASAIKILHFCSCLLTGSESLGCSYHQPQPVKDHRLPVRGWNTDLSYRMDPLSITLSVVALAELTRKIANYVKETKDGPKDRTRILHEAFGLMGLLHMLKDLVDDRTSSCDGTALVPAPNCPTSTPSRDQDPWLQAISALSGPDGPLHQYKISLEGLVDKVMPSGHGHRKVIQALTWKFSKEEITDLLSQIERVKSFILIALEMDHTCVLLFSSASPGHPSPPSAPISSKADGSIAKATASYRETLFNIFLSRWCTRYESARKPMVPAQ